MKNNTQSKDFLEFEIMLPSSLVEMQRKGGIPSLDLVNEWQDNYERRLFINSDIDESILEYVGYYIEKWNREDSDLKINKEDRVPIKIMINTNGGNLDETLYICDLIELSETPIYTIGQAKIYSGGGFILMSGHKRFCYKHSNFLYHSGGFGTQGDVRAVMDTVDFIKKGEISVKEFVLSKTKIGEEVYDKNYSKQWYMDSQEMLDYGIIDEIVTKFI